MGEVKCTCVCRIEVTRRSVTGTILAGEKEHVLFSTERPTVAAIVRSLLSWLKRHPTCMLEDAVCTVHKGVSQYRAQTAVVECKPLVERIGKAGGERAAAD